MRIGRACNAVVPKPHYDTASDQSLARIVYLVRLISTRIWYCNCKWFMLIMTLDMPDDLGHSLKMTTARSVRFFVNLSGARPGVTVYGLLVKCCAMSLFERT